MNLLLFPLKIENPFPVKLHRGKPFKFNEKTFLLLTGVGKTSAVTLANTLSNNSQIKILST